MRLIQGISTNQMYRKHLIQLLKWAQHMQKFRLVSLSTGTASLRDGSLHRAVPGQEIAATLRILSNGSWGVHSTTDIKSILNRLSQLSDLLTQVASRRDKSHKPITLAEVPIIEDEITLEAKKT